MNYLTFIIILILVILYYLYKKKYINNDYESFQNYLQCDRINGWELVKNNKLPYPICYNQKYDESCCLQKDEGRSCVDSKGKPIDVCNKDNLDFDCQSGSDQRDDKGNCKWVYGTVPNEFKCYNRDINKKDPMMCASGYCDNNGLCQHNTQKYRCWICNSLNKSKCGNSNDVNPQCNYQSNIIKKTDNSNQKNYISYLDGNFGQSIRGSINCNKSTDFTDTTLEKCHQLSIKNNNKPVGIYGIKYNNNLNSDWNIEIDQGNLCFSYKNFVIGGIKQNNRPDGKKGGQLFDTMDSRSSIMDLIPIGNLLCKGIVLLTLGDWSITSNEKSLYFCHKGYVMGGLKCCQRTDGSQGGKYFSVLNKSSKTSLIDNIQKGNLKSFGTQSYILTNGWSINSNGNSLLFSYKDYIQAGIKCCSRTDNTKGGKFFVVMTGKNQITYLYRTQERPWQCISGINNPVRINQSGNVECGSSNKRDCWNKGCNSDSISQAINQESNSVNCNKSNKNWCLKGKQVMSGQSSNLINNEVIRYINGNKRSCQNTLDDYCKKNVSSTKNKARFLPGAISKNDGQSAWRCYGEDALTGNMLNKYNKLIQSQNYKNAPKLGKIFEQCNILRSTSILKSSYPKKFLPRTNIALHSNGGRAFSSGSLKGFCQNTQHGIESPELKDMKSTAVINGEIINHCFTTINDGIEGDFSSWIPGKSYNGKFFVGIVLSKRSSISGFRISRDATKKKTNRIGGTYTVYITNDLLPTKSQANWDKTINSEWYLLGSFKRNDPGHLYFEIVPTLNITALKIEVSSSSCCIDELAIYDDIDIIPPKCNFPKLPSEFKGSSNLDGFIFNGINNYFSIPSKITPTLKNSNFTIEFWAKIPIMKSNEIYSIIDFGDSNILGGSFNISFINIQNNVIFNNSLSNPNNENGFWAFKTKITQYIDNQWHHYAVTYKNNSESRLYIDGELKNKNPYGYISQKPERFSNVVAQGLITIGRFNKNYFKGSLKKMKIFNLVRSYEQITESAKNPNMESCPKKSSIYIPMNVLDTNIYYQKIKLAYPVCKLSHVPLSYEGQINNECFTFSGSESFEIPKKISPMLTFSDITVDFWVKFSNLNINNQILMMQGTWVQNNQMWAIQYSSNRLIFRSYNLLFGITQLSDKINVNQWNHFCFICPKNNTSTNLGNCYLNGKPAKGVNYTDTNTPIQMASFTSISIGSGTSGNSYFPKTKFSGSMKKIKIYNTVISEKQIKYSAANFGIEPCPSNSVLYIPMNSSDKNIYYKPRSVPVCKLPNKIPLKMSGQYDVDCINFNQLNYILKIPQEITPKLIKSDFTIEFWLKINSTTGTYQYIFRQGKHNIMGGYLNIFVIQNFIYLDIYAINCKAQIPNKNNFNHFAISYYAGNNSFLKSTKIYINGQNVALLPNYNSNKMIKPSPQGEILIGNDENNKFLLQGKLKKLMVFNKVRTSDEISKSAKNFGPEPCPENALLYIPMSEFNKNIYYLKTPNISGCYKVSGNQKSKLLVNQTNYDLVGLTTSKNKGMGEILGNKVSWDWLSDGKGGILKAIYKNKIVQFLIGNTKWIPTSITECCPLKNIPIKFNGTSDNHSFYFNGSDSHYTLPADVSPQLSGSNFTIEFWAKINPVTKAGTIFKQGIFVRSKLLLIRTLPPSDIYMEFLAGSLRYNIGPFINKWAHYVFTLGKGFSNLYVNGNTIPCKQNWINNCKAAVINRTVSSGPITIGNGGQQYFYKGYLKDLTVYDKVLSLDKIRNKISNKNTIQLCPDDALLYVPMNSNNKYAYYRTPKIPECKLPKQELPFKGLMTDNSYIFGHKGSLNYYPLTKEVSPQLAYSNFTIEFWAKVNNSSSIRPVFAQGLDKPGGNISIFILNNRVYLDFYTINVSAIIENIKNWNHYAILWNNSESNMVTCTKFYVNGKLKPTGGPKHKNKPKASGKVHIGRNMGINEKKMYFNGQLTKLKVYNKLLTLQQIQESAGSLSPYQKCPKDSILYLPMNKLDKNVYYKLAPPVPKCILPQSKVTFNVTMSDSDYIFNGKNTFISIPATIAPVLENSDFTIEFWAKINSITGKNKKTIFYQGANPKRGHDVIQILIDADNVYLNFSNGRADFNHRSLNLSNWNHFSFIFDSSGESNFGSAICYFNGIKQKTTYWNLGEKEKPGMKGQTTAFGKVTIGWNTYVGDYYFNGSLKKLKVYNKILSQSQIKSSAANKNPQEPCPQDSILYLPMNRYNKTVYYKVKNCYKDQSCSVNFNNYKLITKKYCTSCIKPRCDVPAQNPQKCAKYCNNDRNCDGFIYNPRNPVNRRCAPCKPNSIKTIITKSYYGYIKHATNTNFCITLSGNYNRNNTPIQLWNVWRGVSRNSAEFKSQQWVFENGYIKHASNRNFCITLTYNADRNGQAIVLYNLWRGVSRNSAQFKSQQWVYEGGYIKHASNRNFCITLTANANRNGQAIQLWNVWRGVSRNSAQFRSQQWKFDTVIKKSGFDYYKKTINCDDKYNGYLGWSKNVSNTYSKQKTPCNLKSFLSKLPKDYGYYWDPLNNKRGWCRSISPNNVYKVLKDFKNKNWTGNNRGWTYLPQLKTYCDNKKDCKLPNIQTNYNGASNNDHFIFNGVSNYFNISDNISPQLANSSLTILFWANISSSINGYSIIYSQGTQSNSPGGDLGINIYKSSRQPLTMYMTFFGDSKNKRYIQKMPLTKYGDQWHHYTIVRNQSTGNLYLYIDGINQKLPRKIYPRDPGNKFIASGPISIGKLIGKGNYFKGSLKKLSIFNKVLSESEIKSFASNRNPREPFPKNALLYIPMNKTDTNIYKNSDSNNLIGVWKDPANSFYNGMEIKVNCNGWEPVNYKNSGWRSSRFKLENLTSDGFNLVEIKPNNKSYVQYAKYISGNKLLVRIGGRQWNLNLIKQGNYFKTDCKKNHCQKPITQKSLPIENSNPCPSKFPYALEYPRKGSGKWFCYQLKNGNTSGGGVCSYDGKKSTINGKGQWVQNQKPCLKLLKKNNQINNKLFIGESLKADEYIQSTNKIFKLVFQSDGNICVNKNGKNVWCLGNGLYQNLINNKSVANSKLNFQLDSNICIFSSKLNRNVWCLGNKYWQPTINSIIKKYGKSSNSSMPNDIKQKGYIYMQDDGNVTILFNGVLLWSIWGNPKWDKIHKISKSPTWGILNNRIKRGTPYLRINEYMLPRDYLESPNKVYKLIFGTDGNICLYNNNKNKNIYCLGNSRYMTLIKNKTISNGALTFQGDSNLCISQYSQNRWCLGNAYWQDNINYVSKTFKGRVNSLKNKIYMGLLNDGNIVIFGLNNRNQQVYVWRLWDGRGGHWSKINKLTTPPNTW